MKIINLTQPIPVKAADKSALSDSDKRIINNGGCLYPKPKIDFFDRSAGQNVKTVSSGEVISAPNSNQKITEGGSTLSDSDKRILNGGGCLYPNPRRLNFGPVMPQPAGNLNTGNAPTDKTKIATSGTTQLTESDRVIINNGGCLFPNSKRLDLNLQVPVGTENSTQPSAGQQPATNGAGSNSTTNNAGSTNQSNKTLNSNLSTQNSLNATMPGDIAPVSSRSLTLPAQASNTKPPAKPGAIARSALFFAGEVVGLGKALGSGVVDIAKFVYDVESAAIARGLDLVSEGTLNGSFTQAYQPSSSIGTAIAEGRGGETVLKIITEAPDRIAEASIRTGILVEEGKYFEAGMAFGSGPLTETAAALGAVQLATTTPVAAGSFKLSGTAEAPAVIATQATESAVASTPKVAPPSVIPATVLRPAGPFAEIVAEARAAAGGIAGDCEGATAVIRGALRDAMRGTWDWHDKFGRPGFHEFAQLPDGTVIDATAGQYLANGMVTAEQIAKVPGLKEAIESGVFPGEIVNGRPTPVLHNALRALVTQ